MLQYKQNFDRNAFKQDDARRYKHRLLIILTSLRHVGQRKRNNAKRAGAKWDPVLRLLLNAQRGLWERDRFPLSIYCTLLTLFLISNCNVLANLCIICKTLKKQGRAFRNIGKKYIHLFQLRLLLRDLSEISRGEWGWKQREGHNFLKMKNGPLKGGGLCKYMPVIMSRFTHRRKTKFSIWYKKKERKN